MNWKLTDRRVWELLSLLALLGVLATACGGSTPSAQESAGAGETDLLALPEVSARVADGDRLQVVATTSIIGDVVRQVGGEAMDLTVLMQPGQDPHSYQPGAADLTAAADADIIFINGWDLEEGLVGHLANIGREAVLVPVSAGIVPLTLGETAEEHEAAGDDHDAGPVDPHVWQDAANVIHWVDTIRQVLSAADPVNAPTYDANAAAYRTALEQLDTDLRAVLRDIPAERRVLVTNHDNLGYFAAAYGFEIAGTVIPSVSTLAEPTAGALADLVALMTAQGVCTLVGETTSSDQLARTLEGELTGCDEVSLVTLYTDALGPAGSEADSYIGLMRANAAALVAGLGQ